VQAAKVVRADEEVLVEEKRRNRCNAEPVPRTELEPGTDGGEQRDDTEVKRPGAGEDAVHSPPRRPRVETLRAVVLDVEERIEQIEARHPERDGTTERPRLPGRRPRDGEPCADRRQPETGTEPEMAEPRHSLEIGVHDEQRHRDRPQPAHDGIELEDGNEKERQCDDAERADLSARKRSGRQLALRRARIAHVDVGVDQSVQTHGGRPRTHHREGDPDEVVRGRRGVFRQKGARVRKRECEHRVLELDQPRKQARQLNGSSRHVCRCAVAWSPAASSSACLSAGRRTAKPSRQPPGEPGRLTIIVAPRRPASPRESRACGVRSRASARIASATPGASRSSTAAVASGVTSRGANPVPPVVSTTLAMSASWQIAAPIVSLSAGTTRRATSKPSPASRSASRSPLRSSRVPSWTPSDTVSTAALTGVPPWSSRQG